MEILIGLVLLVFFVLVFTGAVITIILKAISNNDLPDDKEFFDKDGPGDA
jgi:hypothetical protein